MGLSGSDGKESACNVGDLGWEDPLEKEMTTYSHILAWRIPQTEEPGGLQSTGLQESDTTGATNTGIRNNITGGYEVLVLITGGCEFFRV